MKLFKISFASALLALSLSACGDSDDKNDNTLITDPEMTKSWNLVWSDDFDGPELDPDVWVRTERGSSDWNNNQSDDPRLVVLRDGCVVLRGIENDDKTADPQDYICGGICTKGKKALGSS